jgi:hypothetical protein
LRALETRAAMIVGHADALGSRHRRAAKRHLACRWVSDLDGQLAFDQVAVISTAALPWRASTISPD